MRVLFTTDQVYLHGGIEKVLSEKVNYLSEQPGYEVHILTTEQEDKKPCYHLSEKVFLHDLNINYIRSKSYFAPVNLLRSVSHYFRLRRELRAIQPDVVVMCNYAFDFYFMPFLYRKAAKVKEFHSSRYFEHKAQVENRSFLKKVFYRLTTYLETKYDAIIALNKDEKVYYPRQNVVVIPNPQKIPESVPAMVKKNWVIAAGRIAPVKGFQYLVASWAKVHEILPDWELHIYGSDYLGTKETLQQQIRQLKLENNILFKGVAPDMMKIFPEYSMYVMSSETECFPMVLLESLSVGLPIVSFNSPHGPANIITDGADGLLAAYKNIDDLAEKIIFLAQNPEKRAKMAQNARKNVQRFEIKHVMKLWMDLFNRIVKK